MTMMTLQHSHAVRSIGRSCGVIFCALGAGASALDLPWRFVPFVAAATVLLIGEVASRRMRKAIQLELVRMRLKPATRPLFEVVVALGNQQVRFRTHQWFASGDLVHFDDRGQIIPHDEDGIVRSVGRVVSATLLPPPPPENATVRR